MKTISDMETGERGFISADNLSLDRSIDGRTELIKGNTAIIRLDDDYVYVSDHGTFSIWNKPVTADVKDIKQSRVPGFSGYRTIKDMGIDEEGFVPHWSLYYDSQGYLWIRQNFSILKESDGTVHVRVIRGDKRVIIEQSTLRQEKVGPGSVEEGDLPVRLI